MSAQARKMRPNYEEPWIMQLKMRLETLESKKQSSVTTPNSASSAGKTAPPASGHRNKH